MSGANLNLARKWRSQSFDQIIGQELPVRMIKNSLYLENFFPVYLFAGTRGCGKTTMARVFAAAVNCAQLPEFQKNPRQSKVPCLLCDSCLAMIAGKHPDFIEIDAASHTGVDNVRNIIDAASLLPSMGRKKIYLIDEAHMLSKAAFNAFLKILEEPPIGVLFILATTDLQKVIDTVRSRCFQLFFNPVTTDILQEHLSTICKTEGIAFEPSGLRVIIKATGGCVRDAINLLEQVRFAASSVTKDAVFSVLGHLDDDRLISLFNLTLTKGPGAVLQFIHANTLEMYSADFIWRQLLELARAALYVKYDAEPQSFVEHTSLLKQLVRKYSLEQLNEFIDTFYSHETIIGRTTAQHAVLEMILLKIAQKNNQENNSGASSMPQCVVIDQADESHCDAESDEQEENDDESEQDEIENSSDQRHWQLFTNAVETLNDPLLSSIFKQGSVVDNQQGQLRVEFPKEVAFFKDWFEDTKKLWHPLLVKIYGLNAAIEIVFQSEGIKQVKKDEPIKRQETVIQKPVAPVKSTVDNRTREAYQSKPSYGTFNQVNSYKKINSKSDSKYPIVDVSDVNLWKKANIVLSHFPGVIREIKENINEQKA